MPSTYQAALSRSGINSTGPQLYWQLRSNGSRRIRVLELGICVESAPSTAPAFAISRATTALGTASTSVTGLPLEPGDVAGTGILESAWSSAPTIDTNYHRRFGLATTAGGGFIWSWPLDRPLVIGTNAAAHALQICNMNASGTTTGTFTLYCVWDE
jgi:hypothetical protein